jgi:hypothetical protein
MFQNILTFLQQMTRSLESINDILHQHFEAFRQLQQLVVSVDSKLAMNGNSIHQHYYMHFQEDVIALEDLNPP